MWNEKRDTLTETVLKQIDYTGILNRLLKRSI